MTANKHHTSSDVFYKNCEFTKRRRDFLTHLVVELLEAHLKIRVLILTLPRDVQLFLLNNHRIEVWTPSDIRKHSRLCVISVSIFLILVVLFLISFVKKFTLNVRLFY